MNFKLLTLSIATATLAFSMTASAAGVKTKAKVKTNVTSKTTSTRTQNANKATEGFNVNGMLGGAAVNGANAGATCSGTALIDSIASAVPSDKAGEVKRYSAVLSGKIQNCAKGQALTDPKALSNFADIIIGVGKKVESGARANDGQVWIEVTASVLGISKDQAKANLQGLMDPAQCGYIAGVSI